MGLVRGKRPAHRADLGGVCLIYFLAVDACVLALVPEHRLEAVDAGVVAGLGLLAGGQEFHWDVADVDGRGCLDDGGRELVLGVLSGSP